MYGADVSKLSNEQFLEKLMYDLIMDPENYDYSLPFALLLVEYAINNIPFTLLHWSMILVLQLSYVLFNWYYCVNIIHKPLYNFIDW